MDLETYPRESLRRQLVAVGIPRERHRMADLVELLPVQLDGKPYEDFDADMVAEVLVRLVGQGLIAVAGPELARLNLRWGERVCHFYRSEDELLTLLRPYFEQGLAEGERCIWLAPSKSARQAYSPDKLEVADEWANDVEAWTREEQRALVQGYNGLRVCGEALELGIRTAALRIKALCTYSAERTNRTAVPDILRAHHAAFVKNREYWQRVPSTDAGAAEAILSALA